MIALSREAESHVDRLIAYYEAKGRLEAAINLLKTLERAKLRIARAPEQDCGHLARIRLWRERAVSGSLRGDIGFPTRR